VQNLGIYHVNGVVTLAGDHVYKRVSAVDGLGSN